MLNFERAALGRRFFVSKKGFLGLAPGKARLGDLICILFGGQTPFILRKDQEQMIPRSDFWRFWRRFYVPLDW